MRLAVHDWTGQPRAAFGTCVGRSLDPSDRHVNFDVLGEQLDARLVGQAEQQPRRRLCDGQQRGR
jgi:hypothetical protein